MNAAHSLDRHERKRIVILGAGFAGLYAALELERTVARDPEVEVLLIDPQNFLLFTPMLHEVASGSLDPSSIVVPIREALRRVQFLRAETTAVDFAARTVTVAYGLDRRMRTIRFDHLLIAAGSQTRFPPSLRPHVHGMKTIHDALVLRNWLIGTPRARGDRGGSGAPARIAHDRRGGRRVLRRRDDRCYQRFPARGRAPLPESLGRTADAGARRADGTAAAGIRPGAR